MEIHQQEDASCTEYQEEQSVVNQSTARSYECNFCKRGFTNAQALGGHMNIHRKEKAKLKQSISTPLLSSSPNKMVVDTPKMMSTTPTRMPWVVISPSTREGHGRSRDGLEETLISEEFQQLPLFVENNPSNMDQNLEICQVLPIEVDCNNSKLGSSSQHGSSISELDLELRLGPEPQNSTSSSSLPTGRTTHFF